MTKKDLNGAETPPTKKVDHIWFREPPEKPGEHPLGMKRILDVDNL